MLTVEKSQVLRVVNSLFVHGDNLTELSKENPDIDVPSIVNWLRTHLGMRVFPVNDPSALGLSLTLVTMACSPMASAKFIYDALGGIVSSVVKDVNSPRRFSLVVYFPHGSRDFTSLLNNLVENELCSSYDIAEIKERYYYKPDYENFDFESGTFGEMKEEERDPMRYEVNSKTFLRPDWVDVNLQGKRQERADLSLKEVAIELGLPFKEAVYHWTKHVEKRQVVGYNVWLFRSAFRLTVYHPKELMGRLSRIPTTVLTSCADDVCYTAALGQVHQLLPTTTFLSQLVAEGHDLTFYLSPTKPTWEYVLTATIPYEYFGRDGEWHFDVDTITRKVEPILRKAREEFT
ncbi:hypothetical protein [Sulfodiicoccus acidiphilus]|uniref:hypothetical protein n=1 Tax=Sulfodiicoccus acidiphilus TaxID=1670455 RepID=UPI000F829CBE|nr:hypothetical protein [Sulfodiicoccus acidiphilus]